MTIALLLLASLAQTPPVQDRPMARPAAQVPPVKAATTTAPATTTDSLAIATGLKAFRQLRFTQAEIEFRKAVEADPNSAAAHFYLGYTYYKMGEPTKRLDANKQKAKEEFAKAFELDPNFKPTFR
jgi:Tfp pilus assembly protein PilF